MWLKKNLNLLVILGACIIVFTFFEKRDDYVDEYNAKIQLVQNDFYEDLATFEYLKLGN